MANGNQETGSVVITTDEQEKLAKLLKHPDIQKILSEVEDK